MREAVTNAVSDSYGVACFSAFSAEELSLPIVVRHWSAYADDHRGMAIEFDGQNSFFSGFAQSKWFFRVDYSEERPVCMLKEFEDARYANLFRMLRAWARFKAKSAWGKENEWRLILPLGEDKGVGITRAADGERVLHFLHLWAPDRPPHDPSVGQVIRRVILGSRASSELEASVRAVRSEPHLHHVELCRAREDPRSFSMKIVPV